MIELYVFNQNLDMIGEISEYINIEFDRKVDTYSQLILNIHADESTIPLLQVGNILSTQSNPSYGYIVQHFNYSQDGSETLEIGAFSLNYLLSFRTIFPQQYIRGTHEEIVRYFVNRNAIQPIDQNRIIPKLNLGPLTNVGTITQSTRTGGNLLDHCMSVLAEIGASMDILMNFETKTMDLFVWQGADRTALQNVNPRVVFSEDFDNILQQSYFLSLIDYKNSPIVAGEGSGINRRIINESQASGLERREIFIDARDLQSTYMDDAGQEITLPPEEYTNALVSRGREAITSTKEIESFECTVDNSQFVYGIDYFIGDRVSVKNIRLGITTHTAVTSVKTVSNSSGIQIYPSLGSGVPDLYRRSRENGN